MNHRNFRHFPCIFGWLLAVFLLAWGGGPAAAAGNVKLAVDPPLEAVVPDGEPAAFTITVADESGAPIPNAKVTVAVNSPPRHWLFSTDFPIVEGTQLLAATGIAVDGTWMFRYVPPIRGTYTVDVQVEPTPDSPRFAPFRQTLTFDVREKPEKVRNALILFAAIIAFGGLAGWLIGRSRGAEMGRNVVTATLLLAMAAAPAAAWAHEHGEGHQSLPPQIHAGNDRLDVLLSLSPDHAVVGKPLSIEGIVRDKQTGQPVRAADVSVKTLHLEHMTNVLETSFRVPDGRFSWKQEFFDGFAHELTLTFRLPGDESVQPLTVKVPVDVEAVQPPTPVVVKTMSVLLGTALAAMAAGYILARRRARHARV